MITRDYFVGDKNATNVTGLIKKFKVFNII